MTTFIQQRLDPPRRLYYHPIRLHLHPPRCLYLIPRLYLIRRLYLIYLIRRINPPRRPEYQRHLY